MQVRNHERLRVAAEGVLQQEGQLGVPIGHHGALFAALSLRTQRAEHISKRTEAEIDVLRLSERLSLGVTHTEPLGPREIHQVELPEANLRLPAPVEEPRLDVEREHRMTAAAVLVEIRRGGRSISQSLAALAGQEGSLVVRLPHLDLPAFRRPSRRARPVGRRARRLVEGRLRQQIAEGVVVQFNEAHADQEHDIVAPLRRQPDRREDVCNRSGNGPGLLRSSRHRVRLARARVAIGKDCRVVAFHRAEHQWAHKPVHLFFGTPAVLSAVADSPPDPGSPPRCQRRSWPPRGPHRGRRPAESGRRLGRAPPLRSWRSAVKARLAPRAASKTYSKLLKALSEAVRAVSASHEETSPTMSGRSTRVAALQRCGQRRCTPQVCASRCAATAARDLGTQATLTHMAGWPPSAPQTSGASRRSPPKTPADARTSLDLQNLNKISNIDSVKLAGAGASADPHRGHGRRPGRPVSLLDSFPSPALTVCSQLDSDLGAASLLERSERKALKKVRSKLERASHLLAQREAEVAAFAEKCEKQVIEAEREISRTREERDVLRVEATVAREALLVVEEENARLRDALKEAEKHREDVSRRAQELVASDVSADMRSVAGIAEEAGREDSGGGEGGAGAGKRKARKGRGGVGDAAQGQRHAQHRGQELEAKLAESGKGRETR
eukprot:scaffold803_cov310-Pinguiococcus_pyrenoidosus.AAC.41